MDKKIVSSLRSFLQRENTLQDQQEPGYAVHEKIKPVNGPYKTTLEKQLQFFYKMRRVIGGQTECQAGNDEQAPWHTVQKFFHCYMYLLTD